jgi:hypothetical protein
MGKPTSDEIKKMEVSALSPDLGIIRVLLDSVSQTLKKFQAMHPEMDFSNAKIS